MELSDLVKKACPYEEFPYPDQLKKKHDRVIGEVEWFMDNKFEQFPKAKVHDCVPAPLQEHYVNTLPVSLVRTDSSIEAGYKVHIRKFVPKIIPLKELISVPKRFVDLVEDFVNWCLTPEGLVVSTSTKVTGHVLGLTLQMSLNEEIVMTILVRVPSNEGEAKGRSTTLDALSSEMLDEFKEKGATFLDEFGKKNNVKAVYLKGINMGAMFSKVSEVILIKGTTVEEPEEANMGLYIEPKCQWSASNRSEALIIDWIYRLADINEETIVFTSASTLRYIPYIFAKKAKEVIAIVQAQTPEILDSISREITEEARTRNGNENIEVVDEYRSEDYASKLKESTLIVWGPLQKWENLRQMLKDGLKKVLFANTKEVGLMRTLKQFGLEGYIPEEVVPVDGMPHTTQFGVIVSFVRAPGIKGQPLERKPSPTPYKFLDNHDDESKQKTNQRPNKRKGGQMRGYDMGGRGPKSMRENRSFSNTQSRDKRGGLGRGPGRRPYSGSGGGGRRPEPIPLMDIVIGPRTPGGQGRGGGGGGLYPPPLLPQPSGHPSQHGRMMGGPPPPLLQQSVHQSPLTSPAVTQQVKQVLDLLNVAQQLAMVKKPQDDNSLGGNLPLNAVALQQLQYQHQQHSSQPVPLLQSLGVTPMNIGSSNSNWSPEPPKPLIPNLVGSSSGNLDWRRRGGGGVGESTNSSSYGGSGGSGGVNPEGNPPSSSSSPWTRRPNKNDMKRKYNEPQSIGGGGGGNKIPPHSSSSSNSSWGPKPLLPTANNKEWWKGDYGAGVIGGNQHQNINRSRGNQSYNGNNQGRNSNFRKRNFSDHQDDRNGEMKARSWNSQRGRAGENQQWGERAGGEESGRWSERRNRR